MRDTLRRVEGGVAVAITAISVFVHYSGAKSAGGLWRDEANTVGLATLPSLAEVWRNLQYDSFPALWIGFVRLLANCAGTLNDPAFRFAGMVIGLLLIGALWINARVFRVSYPLLSLALLALNPSVIRWGDSLRAYGAGMILAVLTGAAIWRYIETPRTRRFFLAALCAVLGVHTLYYNAPVVFAFCAAGAFVAALNRNWKQVIGVLTIGGIAAVSFLIYLPTIEAAATWNPVVSISNYDFQWFFLKLEENLNPLGRWATTLWVFLFLFALWAAGAALALKRFRPGKDDRDRIVYAAVAMSVAAISQFCFLRILSYMTQPWYYLILLTVLAVCVEIVLGTLARNPIARVTRIVLAVCIAAASITPSMRYVTMRLTNADLVARSVERIAQHDDQIVVVPWYVGVSFDRYYKGATPWLSVPAVSFHRFHRYDIFLAAMEQKDQRAPALEVSEVAEAALKRGRTVYVVSGLPIWDTLPIKVLPPAVLPRDGPRSVEYELQWELLFAESMRRHATSMTALSIPSSGPVSDYENLSVTVLRGWRE
jgi:hypothetical protein